MKFNVSQQPILAMIAMSRNDYCNAIKCVRICTSVTLVRFAQTEVEKTTVPQGRTL